jgi:hypothetical protein
MMGWWGPGRSGFGGMCTGGNWVRRVGIDRLADLIKPTESQRASSMTSRRHPEAEPRFPHLRGGGGRSSIVGRHLSKSPKDLLGAEFANLKIASPADCYCTRVAKSLPQPLRTLYRGGRTRAPDRFTSDDGVIDVIERHDHKIGNLGHKSAFSRSHRNARALNSVN